MMETTMLSNKDNDETAEVENLASAKDKMIEIQTDKLISSSATLIGVSSYNEKKVSVGQIDLKTRKQDIQMTIDT